MTRPSSRRYAICGLTLASEIPFPELTPIETRSRAGGTISFELRRGRPAFAEPASTREWSLSGDDGFLTCHVVPGGRVLRFERLGRFFVDERGQSVVGMCERGVPRHTARHLFLDGVLPFALSLQGIDALHATAVATEAGVCAFTGPAGSGKSTLAASFVMQGHPLISDDCLVLRARGEVVLAVPAYPGLRLWEDSAAAIAAPAGGNAVSHYSAKKRMAFSASRAIRMASRPVRLAAIYRVTRNSAAAKPGARPRIERLSARAAFVEITENLFRIDPEDPVLLRRHFELAHRIVSAVPVRRLRVPRDFAALSRVRDAVRRDLGID